MDKIFLHDLKIDTIIGIYDWERETVQTLGFDLEIDWDITTAAASDSIDNTLDYGAIANTIVDFVTTSRYQLIETLAEDLASLLLTKYAMPKIKLTVIKPVVLHGNNIAKIMIERPRS